jgi:hypothetical protein
VYLHNLHTGAKIVAIIVHTSAKNARNYRACQQEVHAEPHWLNIDSQRQANRLDLDM